MSESNPRYPAFLSYSSSDRKKAEKLHRDLENFPIPKELREHEIVPGLKVGKHLRPIFRDRDELSGSASLSEAIATAVRQSEFLIVLCSRDSAESEWVQREIEVFRENGKKNRILPLILNGKPNATADGRPQDECLPPALRRPAEPLAGDLRKEGDGPERGMIKILAGVTGLRFSLLYDRHLKRRRRRRILAGVTGVGLLLVSAVTGKVILEQKAEVEARKREAAELTLKEQTAKHLAAESSAEAERRRIDAEEARKAGEEAVQLREQAEKRRLALQFEAAVSDRENAQKFRERSQHAEALAYLARSMEYDSDSRAPAEMAMGVLHEMGPLPSDLWISDSIHCLPYVRLSSSGARLFVVTPKGDIRIVETRTGRVTLAVSKAGNVVEAGMSRDETLFFTVDEECAVSIYRMTDGYRLHRFGDDENRIFCAAFSPDGRWLATGSSRKVEIHDLNSGEMVRTLGGHHSIVGSVEFSPDGKRLFAFDSMAHAGILWDTASWQSLARLESEDHNVGFFRFSEDGRFLSTLSRGPRNERDENKGFSNRIARNVRDADLFIYNSQEIDDDVPMVDQRRVRILDDVHVRVWDARTGALLKTLRGAKSEALTAAAFSPDGGSLATVSPEGAAHVWNLRQDSEPLILEHGEPLDCLAFSADGLRLMTGMRSGNAIVWDVAKGTPVRVLRGFGAGLSDVGFSSDGRHAITLPEDGHLAVWGTASGRLSREVTVSNQRIGFMRLSPSRERFVVIDTASSVRVWDTRTLRSVFEHREPTTLLLAADLSADGKRLATGDQQGRVIVWDLERASILSERTAFDNQVVDLRFGPDGSHLFASGGRRKMICVPADTSDKEAVTLQAPWDVHSICFVDNDRVIGMAFNGAARSWNYRTGEADGTFRPRSGESRRGDVRTAVWSPRTGKLLTASFSPMFPQPIFNDETARLWDWKSGSLLKTYAGHRDEVMGAALSGDASRVLTASLDNTVRLWDADSAAMLASFTPTGDQLFFADWLPGEKAMLAASFDARVFRGEVLGTSAKPPAWFPDLLRWLSRQRIDADGSPQPIELARWRELKATLEGAAKIDSTRYGDLLRWFMAGEGRPLEPGGGISGCEFADHLLGAQTTTEEMELAYDLDPDNPLVVQAMALRTGDSAKAEWMKTYVKEKVSRLPEAEKLEFERRAAALPGSLKKNR